MKRYGAALDLALYACVFLFLAWRADLPFRAADSFTDAFRAPRAWAARLTARVLEAPRGPSPSPVRFERLERGLVGGVAEAAAGATASLGDWAEALRPGIYRRLIAFCRDSGRHRRALELARAALRRWPHDRGFELSLAQQAALTGDRELYRSLLDRLGAEAADDDQLRAVASLAQECGDSRRAEELWLRLLRRSPSDSRSWVFRARAGLALGELPAARLSLDRAADLARGDEDRREVSRGYRELAMRLRRDGDRAGARRSLEALLRRRPRDCGLWVDLANVQADLHDLPAARRALARAEKLAVSADERDEIRRVYARFGERPLRF